MNLFPFTWEVYDETINSIRTDTDGIHRNLDNVNVSELLKSVEQDRANKMLIYSTAELFIDEAFKTMFVENADVYEVERDKNGNVVNQADGKTPKYRKLTAEELAQLKKLPDGKVHLAVNGIFNDQDAAARYAIQNDKGGKDQGRYFLYFPKTNNFISELLVAGYQKNMENDFWGLTNSTEKFKEVVGQYSGDGLKATGHSRGTMTIDNAMQSFLANNAQGKFPELYVDMVGAAANVNLADQKLAKLQGRENMTVDTRLSHEIQYQGHNADVVSGSFIGQNTPTGGEKLAWYMKPVRWGQMFGDASVHSCYGSGNKGCKKKTHWNDSPDKQPVWKLASESQIPLFNRIGNSISGAEDK